METLAPLQLDFLAPSTDGATEFRLMRRHKWAHGAACELALAEIRLAEHERGWMWGVWLSSRNGSSQGYQPGARWGIFAPSRSEALTRAAGEIREATHRATADEQIRITDWLGRLISGTV